MYLLFIDKNSRVCQTFSRQLSLDSEFWHTLLTY